MTALILSLFLSQTPATPDNAYQQFVEERLLSIHLVDGLTAVRTPQRTFKLMEPEFVEAFTLTPELQGLAKEVQSLALTASTLTYISLLPTGFALISAVLSMAIRSALIPLLIVAAGMLVVSVVLLVIGVVKSNEFTLKFYDLVERHNHQLLQLRPPGMEPPPAAPAF